MSAQDIKAGDVVFAAYPTDEGGALPHFCLVLQVRDEIAGPDRVKLAYGSSRRVIPEDPAPGEFILAETSELARAGLHKPTRFDLKRTASLKVTEVTWKGDIDLGNRTIRRRLKHAIFEAQFD